MAEKRKKYYLDHISDTSLAISLTKAQNVVIQAGGHCGVWAKYLAGVFNSVYTFEPDDINFHCLARNAALPNVYAARGFIGNDRGPLQLEKHKYTGGHYGAKAAGDIPVYRIDDLNLPACDFLMFDVEGMEYPALCGAVKTIEKYRPVIQIEEQGLGEQYGWGSFDKIRNLLPGYREAGRIALDIVFEPCQ